MKPLPRIDALPEDQRLQLADWLLAGTTLARTRELLKETYDVDIPQTNLHRFRKRLEVDACLDDTEESSAARAELINAAATGKANFSAATLHILERQMFELSLDHNDPDRHKTLGDLVGWIHKHKISAVRERMAAVQEGKLKLRQQQLEKPDHDHTAAKIADLNKKITEAFDQHPTLTAIRQAEALGRTGAPPVPAGAPPAEEAPPTVETASVPLNTKKTNHALHHLRMMRCWTSRPIFVPFLINFC